MPLSPENVPPKTPTNPQLAGLLLAFPMIAHKIDGYICSTSDSIDAAS